MGVTLRATRTASVAGAAFIAAAAVLSGVPTGDALPSAAQGGGTDLVDQFFDIAEAVPGIDAGDVLVNDLTLDVDFLGDHIGDHAELEEVSDEAQELFISGEDAESAIGQLVADGARAVLLIEDGYRRLAEFETVVPFNSVDELDVAVGTDEPRHLRTQGIDLIQEGQYRLETVLVGLAGQDLTTEQAARLNAAVQKSVVFSISVDPLLRKLGSDPVSAELIAADRFGVDIAGTAAARWVSYLCVPRGAGSALSAEAVNQAIVSTLNLGQADDCPALPNPETLDPSVATPPDTTTE